MRESSFRSRLSICLPEVSQQALEVKTTSYKRQCDVALTLIWRCFEVVCLLGGDFKVSSVEKFDFTISSIIFTWSIKSPKQNCIKALFKLYLAILYFFIILLTVHVHTQLILIVACRCKQCLDFVLYTRVQNYNASLKLRTALVKYWYLCLPLQGRETYCFSPSVHLSVCLSVGPSVRLSACHKSCPLYNLKPLKLYSRNFIQISISIRWRAECKNGNSTFYTFWVISLWTLCITKIVSAL